MRAPSRVSEDGKRARMAEADYVLISDNLITEELLSVAGRLRLIQHQGVGYDNVDVAAASARGIVVMNAPGANSISVAELALGQILALARHIPAADAAMKQGKWERNKFTGTELYEKTIGIVGLGRIGALVAQRLAGFEVKLIGYDPYVTQARADQIGVELVSLEELMKQSDFITIHLPKTKETVNLIGEEALKKVKPTVRIINAARGGVLDETALYNAIKEGRVAGAGLDVFATEPCVDSPRG